VGDSKEKGEPVEVELKEAGNDRRSRKINDLGIEQGAATANVQ